MELVKRDWVVCGEQRQEEGEGSFRVVQWNTLADGNLLARHSDVLAKPKWLLVW